MGELSLHAFHQRLERSRRTDAKPLCARPQRVWLELGHRRSDYSEFLELDGLRGARIGVARNFFGFNEKVDRVMEDAIVSMRGAGAIIVDPADLPTKGKFDDAEFEVLLYEFKADLNAYLAK